MSEQILEKGSLAGRGPPSSYIWTRRMNGHNNRTTSDGTWKRCVFWGLAGRWWWWWRDRLRGSEMQITTTHAVEVARSIHTHTYTKPQQQIPSDSFNDDDQHRHPPPNFVVRPPSFVLIYVRTVVAATAAVVVNRGTRTHTYSCTVGQRRCLRGDNYCSTAACPSTTWCWSPSLTAVTTTINVASTTRPSKFPRNKTGNLSFGAISYVQYIYVWRERQWWARKFLR